jgi:hypothetical protein
MPKAAPPVPDVLSLVLTIRGQRVILDSDLAKLYGVTTSAVNQAVKRNPDRFPNVFCFQLTREELRQMLSQSVMTSAQDAAIKTIKYRRSDHMPLVFTEYGALMAATVLNSARAVQMSIFIIRAFVSMRQELMTSATILKRLAEIDKTLIEHDGALRAIWHQLQPLLQPPPELPKRRIGFPS